ncbi:MAG: hypothetical protein OXP68_12770 [Anaerolineaceae bacterium]|nr:hypothetical protein [Anaerolineaceae bacterium]MDE0329005.1 hypothetical protein [Anaerolineaceae bacterium]
MKDSSVTMPDRSVLEEFVGAWRNRGIVYPGRFGPGGDVSGETRFHWQMQGRWLCFDSRLQMPGMGEYQVQGGVTLDDDGGYRSCAANNPGNLLVYEGRLEGGQALTFARFTLPARSGRVSSTPWLAMAACSCARRIRRMAAPGPSTSRRLWSGRRDLKLPWTTRPAEIAGPV